AQRGTHPDATFDAARVEAVQPEKAADHREPERDVARPVGERCRLVHCRSAAARSVSIACRGTAPVWRDTSRPRANAISVGMPWTPNRVVVAGLRSVSSFSTGAP